VTAKSIISEVVSPRETALYLIFLFHDTTFGRNKGGTDEQANTWGIYA
jgi:hypothetical protein